MVGVDLARVRRLAIEARDRVFDGAERDGYRPAWRPLSAGLADAMRRSAA
jgi:hypothetical protein